MSLLRPNIEVVCFDLGGVLLRCVDGWAHACERVDLPMCETLAQTEHRDTIIDASNRMEVGEITPRQFAEHIAAVSSYTSDQAMRVLDAWLLELYPRIDALLQRVLAAEVTVALLSNTNDAHWQIVESDPRYAPVLEIPHRFASHQVGARKPDAKVYQHVEKQLGVDPQSILFFDDREENLTAAVWQHWHSESIDPRGDTATQIEKYLVRYGVLS